MSDDRIRALERAWRSSGAADDAAAWERAVGWSQWTQRRSAIVETFGGEDARETALGEVEGFALPAEKQKRRRKVRST